VIGQLHVQIIDVNRFDVLNFKNLNSKEDI